MIRREPGDAALVVDGVRGRFAPVPLRELEVRQRAQAARGVELSIVGPWIDLVKAGRTPPVQASWCRTLTDALRDATAGRADLRFLAALPDLDGGAAAEELARAVDLGAVGGLLASNPQRDGLDADHFVPLWRAAERLRVPLVLHPGYFQPPERLRDHFLGNSVGNPFETTLAVGRLVAADVPGRFPDLRLVLTHAGGFFPYQYGRMEAAFQRWPGNRAVSRRLPSDLLRWFWYDTVLFETAPTRYLLDLVGDDRVLAGSDCPFAMADYRPFEAPATLGLDPQGTARVLGGNALLCFGLAAPAPAAPPAASEGRAAVLPRPAPAEPVLLAPFEGTTLLRPPAGGGIGLHHAPAPGDAPAAPIVPPHRHLDEDELWVIVEGRLRFRFGDRELEAPAGSAVVGPRGVVHSSWNPGPGPCRYLLLSGPSTAALLRALEAAPDPAAIPGLYQRFRTELA